MGIKIAYLGPRYTYSELATKRLADRLKMAVEYCPQLSVQAVAKSFETEPRSDFAVLPYYNYLDGLVQGCLDLIYDNDLTIVGSQRVPIELSLAAVNTANTEKFIYSHAKALAQCSDYLWSQYPDYKQIAVSSTSEGLRVIKSKNGGLAIANANAISSFNLTNIATNIGNEKHGRRNFTDFYLLSNGCKDTLLTSENSLTMIAVTPHVDRPGLLSEILAQVAYYNLNNAKIHSRPAIDRVDVRSEPQMFYLEVVADKDDDAFRRCIDALRFRLTPQGSSVEVVRVLGTYPRPNFDDDDLKK